MSKTVLITGCHKGIGLGLVNQYLKEGYKVVATTRHVEESTELKECLKKAGEDPVIKMDVTDDASIEAALKETQKRIDKLDILINNAGITNRNHPEDKALEINRQEMLDVYNTDVVGALVVTRAFRPLMEKSDVKKIVNLSSTMGSLTANQPGDKRGLGHGNATGYRCAKAALNMATRNLAYELPDYIVVSVHPGHVDTWMGTTKGQKPKISVEDCAKDLFKFTEERKKEDSSFYFNHVGPKIEWFVKKASSNSLEKAEVIVHLNGQVINISTNMGSLGLKSPNNAHQLWVGNTTSYRCAKVAMNMATRNLAYEFPGYIVVAIHPGWVKGNGFCVPFVPPGIKCMKIPYSPTIFEAPRIIRPTIFDLFVADPTVIPQDPSNDPTIFPKRKPFEGDERVEEGYNPRSLPRRSPSQDAHEPSESPPPPSPYNKDQDPGDKGKSDTPYNEPPPESIRRGGPKKDPPKDPDTGQRSASRKSKEEEIIRQGHREPQPSVNRIRGRKYTPEEQREDKNPATSPSGRNITGPLVSVNRLRRNRPKQAFPSASMEGKKPTEDPSKPKGDIKGDPDRVGGYG
ncbi:hypothetical protein QYM36_005548, partial [Artemia franciscana]